MKTALICASRRNFLALAILYFALAAGGARGVELKEEVDWSKFLARHDLVWETLPKSWDAGAFIGNGLLGAMIYSEGTNALQWDVGRSDVANKGDRIAIGRFVLQPGSAVSNGTMRLDMWNAETRGDLKTANDEIKWRSFTHAHDLGSAIEDWEQDFATNEPAPKIEFQHLPANPARLDYQNQPIPENEKNPEPTYGQTNGIFGRPVHWCLQQFKDGGAYVVAWEFDGLINHHHLLFFTVNFRHSAPAETNSSSTLIAETIAQLYSAMSQRCYDGFVASHRAWWHTYYSRSFLSIPDTRVEGFYWIQMYKLASGTRADRSTLDLMGPWFRRTPWPHIWWNLNIELT